MLLISVTVFVVQSYSVEVVELCPALIREETEGSIGQSYSVLVE